MAKPIIAPSKNKLRDGGAFALYFGLTEAKTDDSKDADGKPKHEIVLTALQEGRGNVRDKRYYTREAIQGSEAVFRARKKLFVNHLAEGQSASSEDLRNWCATMKDTWTEPMGDGRLARKVRLKIHEEWLWTRCLEAPEEIALSIEGAGAGNEVIIEGEKMMAIEKILSLNATKFVTYPGNAKMGADLVEGETESPEDTTMDLTALTLKMLREGRADLFAQIVAEAEAPLKAKITEAEGRVAALSESMKTADGALAVKLNEQIADLKKGFTATIEELTKKLSESQRVSDAIAVREALRAKKELVDGKLAASKLIAEAKTPLFLSRLYSLTEKKDGDKVITVAEQVDAEIAEQMRLVTSEFGSVRTGAPAGGAASSEELTEDEAQIVYNHAVLGHALTLEQHRADKKAAAAK